MLTLRQTDATYQQEQAPTFTVKVDGKVFQATGTVASNHATGLDFHQMVAGAEQVWISTQDRNVWRTDARNTTH